MKTYIAQRLGIAVLTLFGMSIVIFVLLRLAPGDIVDVLFSAAGYVNPVEKKAILQELGMDKPVLAAVPGLDRARSCAAISASRTATTYRPGRSSGR